MVYKPSNIQGKRAMVLQLILPLPPDMTVEDGEELLINGVSFTMQVEMLRPVIQIGHSDINQVPGLPQ